VEALCTHLDPDLADVVTFLFFSAWRVGEARTLQWRDYGRKRVEPMGVEPTTS
jgi:integrase